MRKHFVEVLAREAACLAGIADGEMLASWRHGPVEELMTPESPYVLAMRTAGSVRDRADFLDRWRELIAGTVDRLLERDGESDKLRASANVPRADVDAERLLC